MLTPILGNYPKQILTNPARFWALDPLQVSRTLLLPYKTKSVSTALRSIRSFQGIKSTTCTYVRVDLVIYLNSIRLGYTSITDTTLDMALIHGDPDILTSAVDLMLKQQPLIANARVIDDESSLMPMFRRNLGALRVENAAIRGQLKQEWRPLPMAVMPSNGLIDYVPSGFVQQHIGNKSKATGILKKAIANNTAILLPGCGPKPNLKKPCEVQGAFDWVLQKMWEKHRNGRGALFLSDIGYYSSGYNYWVPRPW